MKTGKRFYVYPLILGSAVILTYVLGQWDLGVWFLELFSHFRPYQGVVLLVCSLILLIQKKIRLGVLGTLIAIWILIPVFSEHLISIKSSRDFEHQPLNFITFNVLTSNDKKTEVLQYLQSKIDPKQTNIFLLLEVNDQWDMALSPLKVAMPYHLSIPRPDNFGILMLSDRPLKDLGEVPFGESSPLPALHAKLPLSNGSLLHIYGIHPLPPVGADAFRLRNEYLMEVRRKFESLPKEDAMVVLGDLNTSPWSPTYRRFAEPEGGADFSRSTEGEGFQNTWHLGGTGIGVPIDFILSWKLSLESRLEIGPDLGSDHLPVRVEFGK